MFSCVLALSLSLSRSLLSSCECARACVRARACVPVPCAFVFSTDSIQEELLAHLLAEHWVKIVIGAFKSGQS